jgi:hypothetical protein
MYTYQSHTDVINKDLRSRVVTVTFGDGVDTVVQTFRFSIGTTDLVVKRAVKQFLDELNLTHTPIVGDVTDYTEPTPPEPTADEVVRTEWLEKFRRLEAYNRMIAAGITLTAGEQTALNNLKTDLSSVTTAKKNEYSLLI